MVCLREGFKEYFTNIACSINSFYDDRMTKYYNMWSHVLNILYYIITYISILLINLDDLVQNSNENILIQFGFI